MKRLARACLAFLVAFNLVIFQLAPVAQAEELTVATQVPQAEESTSQYASEPVDTDPILDGCYRYHNGEIEYLHGNYVDTSSSWYFWKTMSAALSDGTIHDDASVLEGCGYIWENSTSRWNVKTPKDGSFYFGVVSDTSLVVYKCEKGSYIRFRGCLLSSFQYTNYPVFASVDAGVYFYKNKKLQNESDLITDYLPLGYSYNETLGLKLGSSSAEVGSYDENIGYPINFDYRGNLLSLNTLRSSTWDFYKDGNGNAITRSEQEEKYNIEIFINFDMKNSVMNNITSGNGEFAGMYVPNLEMPARALSYYSGIANSCQCSFEPWSETMKRAFEYFEEKGDLSMSSFDKNAFYYFNTKNLNVWARYFYIDDADNKHFGDWVKWSKEGVSVVHPDDTVSDNAVPCDSSYKSSFLEKEEGYKAEDQNITIDGITINVTPYFEGPEDDPEYYPSSEEEGGGSSGSGGSGSGIFGTIGELLGNLLSGIVDLITGLLKGLSSAIYKIVKSIKEFFSDISGAGDIFGELFDWLPGEVTVLLSLSFVVAIICRLTGR